MNDQDERPIYSDLNYFTRGRSGYRAEIKAKEKLDFWVGLLALMAIGLVIGLTIALTR